MVAIGDIASGHAAGFKNRGQFIWSACSTCGSERWVPFKKFGNECRSCTGKRTVLTAIVGNSKPRPYQSVRQRREGNPCWRGGVTKGGRGYRYILLEPSDPLYCMANREGRAMEHRLVMARMVGRPLADWEQVHHLNGRRDDNAPENLELWKLSQPAGIRQADYHCPGCRCEGMIQ